MENPFESDTTQDYDTDEGFTLPEAPSDVSAYRFPSAEGWQPPEDFTPTVKRPFPTQRCGYTRPDGSQCKKFALMGTGLSGTGGMPVCTSHGGQLPNVKKMAEALVEAARMKLLNNVDLAIDTLVDLTKVGTADQVRLGAAKEILALTNIKGADMTVEVNHNVSAASTIADRLKSIAARSEPAEEIIDAEVVDNEPSVE